MMDKNYLALIVGAGLVALPMASASGQILVDSDFAATDYTTSSAGTFDLRYGVNYGDGSLDVFGDGFIQITAPEAPSTPAGSAATTGLFIAANNNNTLTVQESFGAAVRNGLNVGKGTGTENYVVQIDIFNATGPGVDDGAGNQDFTGTTNYSFWGINQANTTVRLQELNNSATTGQGVALAITADTGAAEDYLPHYGGVGYRDRAGLPGNTDFRSGGVDNPALSTGLVGDIINNYWETQGFEIADSDEDPSNDLNIFTGDSLFFSPDPTDTAGFLADGSGVDRSYNAENLPVHNDPFVYDPDIDPAFLVPNDQAVAGVPYNRWATHRAYYVDGVVTFTVEDPIAGVEIPLLQQEINNPSEEGDDTVFDETSEAGSVILGFWDRFGGSVAFSPEGGNFALYDNLIVSEVTEAPDVISFLEAGGFIPGDVVGGLAGDFNGNGTVEQADLDLVLGNWGASTTPAGFIANTDGLSDGVDQDELDAVLGNWGSSTAPSFAGSTVPEPATAAVLAGLGLLGLRRRKA